MGLLRLNIFAIVFFSAGISNAQVASYQPKTEDIIFDTIKATVIKSSDSLSSDSIKSTKFSLADSSSHTKINSNAVQASQYKKSITRRNKEVDSSVILLKEIGPKYVKQINKKVTKYSDRLTSKTEKTLIKLSKWESKIKELLDKASPETSQRLFAKSTITFSSLLNKMRQAEKIADSSVRSYHKYYDQLNTNLEYLQSQKASLSNGLSKSISNANLQLTELDQTVANSEACEKIIKERKKQLLEESVKYIGHSKYLSKISKESYYYVETLRNYKTIFADKKAAEKTAISILNRIPQFIKFAQQYSILASLFGSGSNTVADVAGLQTRSSINDLIQQRIAAGGPNARQVMQQGMQQAQGELSKVKEKVLSAGGSGNADDLPDFKPNQQKSKTFFQRLEYGGNYQFSKSQRYMPAGMDIALNLGYKINDKSLVGLGASYKLGLGTIQRVRLSNQGIGLRTYTDWKLKKQFFISGGFEINYYNSFKGIGTLQNYDAWQQSGLFGITKKLKIKTKYFQGSNLQLLYDFLHKQHLPVSQPVIFRAGYTFK